MGIEFIEMERKTEEFFPANLSTTLHFIISQLNGQQKHGPFATSTSFYYANVQFKYAVVQPCDIEGRLILKTALYLVSNLNQDCHINLQFNLLKLGTKEKKDIHSHKIPIINNKNRTFAIDLHLNEIDADYIEKDSIVFEVLFYANSNSGPLVLDHEEFLEWHASEQESKWNQIRALKEKLDVYDRLKMTEQIQALKKQLEDYKNYENITNIFKEGLRLLGKVENDSDKCSEQTNNNFAGGSCNRK